MAGEADGTGPAPQVTRRMDTVFAAGDGPQDEEGCSLDRKGRKKTTFGDIMSMLLMLVALCVFLFSAYTLYGFYKEYKAGSDEYDNLESNYASTSAEDDGTPLANLDGLEDDIMVQKIGGNGLDVEMETVMENGRRVTLPTMKNPIDFAQLQEVNEDIVGWLRVRALDISYPVVQGEDNDYYLHRTFEKTDNFAGCLFMNCDNAPDYTDQNTIIYGHNMKNGSMFGKLKQFRDEETFNKSKYFWIFTKDLIYQYRIFSAYVVNKTGMNYQTFFSEDEFEELLKTAYESSEVDNSNVIVDKDDRIVTLSTCTGDDATRFVVLGKLAQVYVAK